LIHFYKRFHIHEDGQVTPDLADTEQFSYVLNLDK